MNRSRQGGTRLVLAVLAAAACIGCGGGGSDGGLFVDEPEGPPPLRVIDREPVGDAVGSRFVVIRATFDRTLDASTIGYGSLTVRDDAGEIPGIVAPVLAYGSCVGVAFTPVTPLEAGACYRATVTTAIEDEAHGMSLAKEKSWTFCVSPTPAYAWSAAQTLAEGRHPAIAMGPDGDAVAVWLERDAVRGRPFEAQGSGWQDIQVLLEDSAEPEAAPDLALRPSTGHGWLAVPLRGYPMPDRHALWLRRLDREGRVTGISAARGDAGSPMGHARIAVDADGRGLVVFERQGRIAWCRGDDRSWNPPATLHSLASGQLRRPRVAMNAAGNGFAVWEVEGQPRPYHVWGARFSKGAGDWTWLGPLAETSAGGDLGEPAVALDEGDDAIVVWTRDDGTASSVMALVFPADEDLPPVPVELSAGLAGRAEQPHVAVHADGSALAVWAQHIHPTEHRVMAMRHVPGVGWRDRATVVTRTFPQENPRVATGPAGDAIVVWHDVEIHASHHLGGASWARPKILDALVADEIANRPRVVIDGIGRAIAVWQRFVDGRWVVRGTRYE